eukprot:10339268-Alexandrium_andersonii.AAC.1
MPRAIPGSSWIGHGQCPDAQGAGSARFGVVGPSLDASGPSLDSLELYLQSPGMVFPRRVLERPGRD